MIAPFLTLRPLLRPSLTSYFYYIFSYLGFNISINIGNWVQWEMGKDRVRKSVIDICKSECERYKKYRALLRFAP